MIKAKALKAGDKVAIIAPSSPASKLQIERVKENLDYLELDYDLLDSCFASHGHLAGNDDLRLQDLHHAFLNYDGVICLKGGYGTPRLLDLIDYDLIKNNPKVFVGFSDITSLHIAFQQRSNLITFHGPMASSPFDEFSLKHLKAQIFGQAFDLSNPDDQTVEVLVAGQAQGQLVGGNLSLLCSTLGSPYEIDTKNKILFIEEVSEASYRIDRMLNSLRLAGKFKDCNGIVLGTFSDCEPEDIPGKKKDLDLVTIFKELLPNKPILRNIRAGHNYPQITLPLGSHVEINKGLVSKEAGVL